MQLIKKSIYGLNRHATKVSMVVVLFLMFITVGDVFGRFFFNKPIPGTFELTRISLVVIVFLSFGYAQIQKVNVSITLIFSKYPIFLQRFIELLVTLVSLALFSVVFWQMLMYAERIAKAGQFTTVLRLPMHPWILIAAFGALLLCLALVWDLIQILTKIFKGDVVDES